MIEWKNVNKDFEIMDAQVKKAKEINFTEGPITKPLVRFLLPILAALVIQFLYYAVDLFVVGKFCSTATVAGVSMASEVSLYITEIAANLATGCTVLIGTFLGEKKKKEAGDVIGTGIIFFVFVAVVLTFATYFLASPMLKLFQTPEASMADGIIYIQVCAIGMIFTVAYNIIGSIFRGIGDSITPLITVAVSCVINIGLDFLLVGGLSMGAKGAALATIIAQAISVVVSLIIIKRKGLPFSFTKESMKFNKYLCGKIFKLGFPLALENVIVSASFLIVYTCVNSLDMGVAATASVGIAGKVINFIVVIPIAFAQALSAFVAHNMGAGRLDRAKKALKQSVLMSLVVACVMFTASFFFGSFFTNIFSDDPDVVVYATLYLKGFSFDTFMTSILFCFIGFLNGCGKTFITLWQGIVGVIVRVGSASFFASVTWVTLFFMGMCTPISTFFQNAVCIIYFIFLIKKLSKQDSDNQLKI